MTNLFIFCIILALADLAISWNWRWFLFHFDVILNRWINLASSWGSEFGFSPGTLSNLCRILQIEFEGSAHSGYYDTLNTVKVLKIMAERRIDVSVNSGFSSVEVEGVPPSKTQLKPVELEDDVFVN